MSIRPSPTVNRARAGFTLVELLIVVVIVGILATIAVPRYSVSKAKAIKAAAMSDLRNLVTAQEDYHGTNLVYSGSPAVLGVASSSGVTLTIVESTGAGWSAAGVMDTGMCAIYTGNAAPVAPATAPNVVACD